MPVAIVGSETVLARSTTVITFSGTYADLDDTLPFIITALFSGTLPDSSTISSAPFFLSGDTVRYTAGSTSTDVFYFIVSDGEEFSSAEDVNITIIP